MSQAALKHTPSGQVISTQVIQGIRRQMDPWDRALRLLGEIKQELARVDAQRRTSHPPPADQEEQEDVSGQADQRG